MDEIAKANALIRHHFTINPETLSEREWAKLMNEALWLERYRMKQQADLMGAMFGQV